MPTDFYQESLYKTYAAAPDRLPVGTRVVDVSWQRTFILSQATDAKIANKAIVQQSITVTDDTQDIATAKGAMGQRIVEVTAAGVEKDAFMNGTLTTLGDVQYIYSIQSNSATDSGKIELVLSDPLIDTIAKDDDIRLRTAFKVEQGNAAGSDPAPAVGIALLDVDANEYFFAQQTGEAEVVAAEIDAGDISSALAKAANGRVDSAIAGQQKIAYHTRDRSGAVSAGTIIPVTLAMSNLL